MQLPPPSRLDYLLFVGYLLDGREKITAPGRGGYMELFAEKHEEGTIYFLDFTSDGNTERVLVVTVEPHRIDFLAFTRGNWQGQIEQFYNIERKNRPKRLAAGAEEDATGVPA